MELKITIKLDNAAFQPDPINEIESILDNLKLRFDAMSRDVRIGDDFILRDSNGNRVGVAEFTE